MVQHALSTGANKTQRSYPQASPAPMAANTASFATMKQNKIIGVVAGLFQVEKMRFTHPFLLAPNKTQRSGEKVTCNAKNGGMKMDSALLRAANI